MSVRESLKECQDGRVAIFGYGITGRALAVFLEEMGVAYTIFDQNGGDREQFTLFDAQEHSLVVYSPGFKQDHAWLTLARDEGLECLGELDFSSQFFEGEVVAVTGTNGKTTTAEFLAYALAQAGVDVAACGNNEAPVPALGVERLSKLETLVLEVSSFQSESLHYLKPSMVIFTNIGEDHLDRYGDLEEYFRAKWNLVDRLGPEGLLVTTQGVVDYAQELGMEMPAYRVISGFDGPEGTVFDRQPFAINYGLIRYYFDLKGYGELGLKESASSYELPESRMRKIGELGGVSFWNDSKATNFLAVEEGLKRFRGGRVFWIGGGRSKGGDIKGFVDRVRDSVDRAYFVGENGHELQVLYGEGGEYVGTLEQAVERAYSDMKLLGEGGDVLFSPGFASFDQYRNYKERGKVYENVFFQLKQKEDPVERL